MQTATPAIPTIEDQDIMTPFCLGEMDAQMNMPFAPEDWHTNRAKRIEYTLGFMSVRPNEIAEMFVALYAPDRQVA